VCVTYSNALVRINTLDLRSQVRPAVHLLVLLVPLVAVVSCQLLTMTQALLACGCIPPDTMPFALQLHLARPVALLPCLEM
jgi:hypothetical protein